jgi:NADH:ubiquinone oxidoreductase subunit F (NADH-binding)
MRAAARLDTVPRLLEGIVRFRSSDRLRLAGPPPDTLNDHLQRYGHRPRRSAQESISALATAGLSGRGGAHFRAAAKWQTTLAAGGGGYVVANAAEGEPCSAKDAALLQHRPHLVLDGLATAAEALGARGSVVWLHEHARESQEAISRALAERRASGLIESPVRVLTGPDRYLTGESSAVINALGGGPAVPVFTRTPAARAGLGGLPTLVQNAETLARVALLARTNGYGEQPGPLVTIVSPGTLTVAELSPYATVEDILRPVDTVLVGGYAGRWVRWPALAGQPLGGLVPALGPGVIAPLPPDACGLTETAAVLDYLARSSARQCGPCLFGTRALADTMARVADGTARRADVRRIAGLIGEVGGRGACGLPDGAAQVTGTALAVFADDVDRHLHGRCLHPGAEPFLPIPVGHR